MAGITLEHVKKVYNGVTEAVHDFDMVIGDREFIVLVGPSGCGKSTTLRMIAGLEDVSEGTIRIGDRVVNDVEPRNRDVAMIFQNYSLYPQITVYENMAFGLKLRRLPDDEIHRRVSEAAEILGLTDVLGKLPKTLSGGQRQRVAIGRAIVREPKVFLMDEPFSNLDVSLRAQMRAELMKMRKRVNASFVYVTHDQAEAMTLGDRIVVMKDGDIMQAGTPREIFDKPRNLFVAGFIGSPRMNFLKARLVREEDKYLVQFSGTETVLNEAQDQALREREIDTRDIILGVRPEHITALFEEAENAAACTIGLCEMMGSELYLHLTTETDENIILRLPTMDLTAEQQDALFPGNKLYITFRNKAMHLFDPETENNLIFG